MQFKQTVSILGVTEKTGEKNGKMYRLEIVHLLADDFQVYDAILAKEISDGQRLAELFKIHNEQYEVTLAIVPKGKYDVQLQLVDF